MPVNATPATILFHPGAAKVRLEDASGKSAATGRGHAHYSRSVRTVPRRALAAAVPLAGPLLHSHEMVGLYQAGELPEAPPAETQGESVPPAWP